MNKTLRELSTERTLAQVAEYGDARIAALKEALSVAEATIQRLAPDGSRATQGTRDVIAAALGGAA